MFLWAAVPGLLALAALALTREPPHGAAPVAVARAAGLHVSRIDGSALIYNQENPWLPDLLICRPELAGKALEALRR